MAFEFNKFVDQVLGDLIIGQDETSFLRQLSCSAGRYPDFVKILKENPAIEAHLIDAANRNFGTKMDDLISSTEVALGMMGFVPARNYLTASIILKNSNIAPGDPLVRNTLRYALEGEMNGGAHAPRFFAGGLIFDFVMNALIKPDDEGELPATPKFVADTWRHSLQVTQVASQLAKRLYPTVDIEKEICLHALVHDVGKLAFYLLDDQYWNEKIIEEGKKNKKPPLVPDDSLLEEGLRKVPEAPPVDEAAEAEKRSKILLHFPEKAWLLETDKAGGVSHDYLGHLILWTLGFLPDTTWVVLYHHQPFLAERRGGATRLHATIVWLADQIMRYKGIHKVSRFGDKMVSGWYQVAAPVLENVSAPKFKETVNSLVYT